MLDRAVGRGRCFDGMSILYALGIGGSECPLKPSNGAGALILRGLQGWWGFASSELIPLISPWARELFHLESFLEKSCKSVAYDFMVEEFFHSFLE